MNLNFIADLHRVFFGAYCLECNSLISDPRRKLYCSGVCAKKADRKRTRAAKRARLRATSSQRIAAITTHTEAVCACCSKPLPVPRRIYVKYCSTSCQKRVQRRTEHARAIKDPKFHARRKLHNRLQNLLKMRGRSTTNALYPYLGCSGPELISHIESQWKDGMSWENWKPGGWNVDHIIPYSFFDLTREDHRHICCHHLNVRPVWAEENVEKADSIDESIIPPLILEKANAIGILHQLPYLKRKSIADSRLEQASFAF